MRKDLKLGLAVGGIFLSAVLIYVLFFAGGNRNKDEQIGGAQRPPADAAGGAVDPDRRGDGAGGTPGDATGRTYRPGSDSVIAPPPTTRPADSWVRPGDGGTPSVVVRGPRDGTTTPDPGSSPTNPVAQGGTWDWGQALNQGANPAMYTRRTPSPEAYGYPPMPIVDDAGPTTRPGTARTYVVKQGDTLWSIAKAEYGSPQYYSHLVRANPKIDPTRLRYGTRLVIPAKEQVVPPGAAALLAPTTRPVDPATQYRVQSGDSLHAICKKLYGRTDAVDKLYQLNKNLIGPDPGVLKLNMVLQLPERPGSVGNTVAPTVPGTFAGPLQ